MRALVVEDDPVVGSDLARSLSAAGFIVDLAKDGQEASFKGSTEDYAIAVLDLGLPRLDGLSVLRRWRADGRTFPVVILSARSDWTEKVEGIEAGADDYLAKPFEIGELVARMRGVMRRAAGRNNAVIRIGAISVDTNRMSATLNGAPLGLSPLEFRLLDCLAHNPDRAVPAGELVDQLYGAEYSGGANAIEALVARLRRKIGADLVVTQRGFGYRLANSER